MRPSNMRSGLTLMQNMSVGSSVHADNSKTIEMFDWEPIPLEKSILESTAVVKTTPQLNTDFGTLNISHTE